VTDGAAVSRYFGKGVMMKKAMDIQNRKKQVASMGSRLFARIILVLALGLTVSGCRYPVRAAKWVDHKIEDLVYLGEGDEFAHPGETEAEVRRRHERASRLNDQMRRSDIDMALMRDRPSMLTDRRLP
jgi:hypothetical protein